MLEVAYDRGIHLPAEGLWLDPARRKPLAFVSHAHSDHTGRHHATIATPQTLELMRIRMGRPSGETHALPFSETRDFGRFTMRLLPAGHVLGSAQCLVEGRTGTLLYTGDFKLRRGATSGEAESCHAETLIMETTFGLPRYVFPPAGEVMADILSFCQESLAGGAAPVLLAYSLGKAQEVLHAVAGAGFAAMPHPAIVRLLPVYEAAGLRFPGCRPWDPDSSEPCVMICPPGASAPRSGPRCRTALISGWAMDASARFRSRCDAAFPLSDHAGYDDLLRHVQSVAPRRVLTLHGFAQEFARDLRLRGLEAWALTGPNQLDLPFGTAPSSAPLGGE